MASAYAALVSVMQILDQIQHHPRPPISLHEQQILSLTETVSYLQQFLESACYSSSQVAYDSEADPLEMKIADAAQAAEDVIESHIVDRILADAQEISSLDFHESLQKVIYDLESVKKEAMDVKNKMQIQDQYYQLPAADSSASSSSSSVAGPEQYRGMVGFDDILEQVLDKLTSRGSGRKISSITGMGGMGKSTLAINVYQNQLVVEHFHLRAWVTISEKYNMKKVLMKLLEGAKEDLSRVDEYDELGSILYKKLSGRRYLIIIDDIWNIEAWDQLRHFLPDNNNGSRIMITTRLSNLARTIDDSHSIEMPILDEDNCWKLFCKHVFKEEECPLEFQGIGKRIVKGCKGLPLSISVVGGLLAKSKRTKQYWEEIAENLNSTVNLENDKHCLQILYTSYYNLPVHLKPYFLYMGVNFAEDEGFLLINALVVYFISEGFVKPVIGKSLEEAAIDCLIELVERNLILIGKTENKEDEDWMHKKCSIHDLLGELCLRESEKQKFLYVVREGSANNIPQNSDSIRRICVANNTPEAEVLHFVESASLLRSLWWYAKDSVSLSSIRSRLLRTLFIRDITDSENFDRKVNLRAYSMADPDAFIRSISSLSRFWNLQRLQVSDLLTTRHEIWMMPQLRSIIAKKALFLPFPPSSGTDNSVILKNLHTLSRVLNFKCSEEVVKRIPHIEYLSILYMEVKYLNTLYMEVEGSYDVDYCLNNLGRLQRLKNLFIEVQMPRLVTQNQNLRITFPHSLISLLLGGISLHWDDVTAKIGSLPLLQYLYLVTDSCIGAKWKTMKGHFCSLRELLIDGLDLKYWITDHSHFPRLKSLHLVRLKKLKAIPSSIGDIPTLERIRVRGCCKSVKYSAQTIKEEQEELGNEDLQVEILEDDDFGEDEDKDDEPVDDGDFGEDEDEDELDEDDEDGKSIREKLMLVV